MKEFNQQIGKHTNTLLVFCVLDELFPKKQAMQIIARTEAKYLTLLISGIKRKSFIYWNLRFMAFLYNLKFEGEKHILIADLNKNQISTALRKADIFMYLASRDINLDLLYESMALKTPFMVSPVGKSKEIVNSANGGGLLFPGYKNEGQFYLNVRHSAHYLTLLLNDKDKLKVMAERGYDAWLKTQ